jgi:hypothetical protein
MAAEEGEAEVAGVAAASSKAHNPAPTPSP